MSRFCSFWVAVGKVISLEEAIAAFEDMFPTADVLRYDDVLLDNRDWNGIIVDLQEGWGEFPRMVDVKYFPGTWETDRPDIAIAERLSQRWGVNTMIDIPAEIAPTDGPFWCLVFDGNTWHLGDDHLLDADPEEWSTGFAVGTVILCEPVALTPPDLDEKGIATSSWQVRRGRPLVVSDS